MKKNEVHQPVSSCCSVAGELQKGTASRRMSTRQEGIGSSHEGSSAGLGLDVHVELQPRRATLPTAHLLKTPAP